MKHLMLAAAALIALPGALAAQDTVPEATAATAADSDGMDEAMAKLRGMFPAEPLTAEQQARLPAAERLIARIIPEGTMAEMIDKMMGGVLGPIMELGPDGAATTIARQIGVETYALDLDEAKAGELASLFDPAWQERQKREAALFPEMMRDMMATMEPTMRKAMSELYAIRFTDSELAEIDGFFATATGTKYARESFLMASDPRVAAASMDAMPAMMGMIGDMERRMTERTADLPAARSFDALSAAEQAKVAELTGYSIDEIRQSIAMRQSDDAALDAMATAAEQPDE
ncbi:hypothetical protein [uncultured Erythrobacter sp.]|uniref:hypothetical protein n=1 Tax=uncultured Erythrobacter sp. TaxID=263913 RepID=UPI00265AFDAD|nr:hypothetical protein [uncultured Erythrobacter sp.]